MQRPSEGFARHPHAAQHGRMGVYHLGAVSVVMGFALIWHMWLVARPLSPLSAIVPPPSHHTFNYDRHDSTSRRHAEVEASTRTATTAPLPCSISPTTMRRSRDGMTMSSPRATTLTRTPLPRWRPRRPRTSDGRWHPVFGFWVYLMSDCLIFAACCSLSYGGAGPPIMPAGPPVPKDLFDLPLVAHQHGSMLLFILDHLSALP